MDTQLLLEDASSSHSSLLTVFALDVASKDAKSPEPQLLTDSDVIKSAAAPILASGEFKAGATETLLIHAPQGLKAQRLLIIGLGKAKSYSLDELRKAAGAAVRYAKPRGIREVSIVFPKHPTDTKIDNSHVARVLIEGALVADVDNDIYRSDRKDQSLTNFNLIASTAVDKDILQKGFALGSTIADGQNFARALVNEPGNKLTPTVLGERAASMAKEAGLKAEVYSTEKLKELGMGAFLGVAQGSAQPPALIVLTYDPPSASVDGPVFGLVGKGITFDTGGISIKSADGMEKMKYDMAGAAAMLGAMYAIARIKPSHKVISVICSAENMPSGTAYKPGDILTSASGKTIEINNTDAEGRLVLADGLWYAQQLGATHLVDAATLTGAVAVALGLTNVGIFSNDDETCTQFQNGTKVAGESYWRLPCTDDYLQLMKSSIADLMNTSNTRWGGASTAAAFLKEFAEPAKWLHLDIAGCAWIDAEKPWIAKGPSGIAVRSIVEWVTSYDA